MASRTLPVERALTVYASTDFEREFRWLPDGLNPQDFTGWRARMLIGPLRGAATLVLTTETSGIELTEDGKVQIHITSAQTSALRGTSLSYLVDLINPENRATRFLRGRITLVRELEAPR